MLYVVTPFKCNTPIQTWDYAAISKVRDRMDHGQETVEAFAFDLEVARRNCMAFWRLSIMEDAENAIMGMVEICPVPGTTTSTPIYKGMTGPWFGG